MSNPLSEFEARQLIGLLKRPNAPSVVEVFETFRIQRQWDEAETRASLTMLNRVLTEQVLLLNAIEAEQSGQDEPADNG